MVPKQCEGCKSLRYVSVYDNRDLEFCASVNSYIKGFIPNCPCSNCIIKVKCRNGCEEFKVHVREYEEILNRRKKINDK